MASASSNRPSAGRPSAPETPRLPTVGPGCSPSRSGNSGSLDRSSPISASPGNGRSQPPSQHPAASAAPSQDFSPSWAPRPVRPNRAEKRRAAVRATHQVPDLAIQSPADDRNGWPNEEFRLRYCPNYRPDVQDRGGQGGRGAAV